MKLVFRRTISLVVLIMLFSSLSLLSINADIGGKTTYNRYNIVLVADTSGSMRSTDGKGLRFDAIGKFVALLAERGNRVGSVVFNGDIAFRQEMTDADGFAIKREVTNNIKNIPPDGYTNIGKALQSAVEMLNSGKNPNLPSIILLFTDGNTDMPTQDTKTLSLTQKANVIEQSRESGYKIHTISLNADGSANSSELSQIANATGGQFREVSKSSDLESVFNMYYSLIYGAIVYENNETVFPASGEINGTFGIPSVGVEEVNITLSGKTSDYSLTNPNGQSYSKDAISSFAYVADSYTIIKIIDPISGTWKYNVKGIPKDKVQINIVYNTDLASKFSISPQKDTYGVSDQILTKVVLTESATDLPVDKYKEFKAVLSVKDGNGAVTLHDMVIGNSSFEYNLLLEKKGSYSLSAEVTGIGHNLSTDLILINVGNSAPTFKENIHKIVWLWPFTKNDTDIDLTSGAIDAQDTTLRYEVESSAFNKDEYSIKGNKLAMTSYSLSKGSFKIRAYDSEGAHCTFDVVLQTINVTLWGAILIGLGLLIALVIIVGGAWWWSRKRFFGTSYVQQFDNEGTYYEEVEVKTPTRGKRYLSKFNMTNSEFNVSKCYFQATGARDIFFITDKPVFGNGKQGKKFTVDGQGFVTEITTVTANNKGIRIRFVSQKNNGGMGGGNYGGY